MKTFKKSGFTLIEMVVVLSLLTFLFQMGTTSLQHFFAQVKLSEGREMIDNTFVTLITKALTGKSKTADYYSEGETTARYHISEYFLYFETSENYNDRKSLIAGELQKEPLLSTQENDVYKISYIDILEIPFPVFLQELLYTNTQQEREEVQKLLVVFSPPFAHVSFLPHFDSLLYHTNRESSSLFKSNKELVSLQRGDFSHDRDWYFLFPKDTSSVFKKGEIELALQYKEKTDDTDSQRHYFLREYTKFDSNNQISHFWNL
jgi:prepilin-type N-terminal cleavage/methylation domain-containing protein